MQIIIKHKIINTYFIHEFISPVKMDSSDEINRIFSGSKFRSNPSDDFVNSRMK